MRYPKRTAKARRNRIKITAPGQPYDRWTRRNMRTENHDNRVETVEDWNETEQRRRQQMEREPGQEHPESATQESES